VIYAYVCLCMIRINHQDFSNEDFSKIISDSKAKGDCARRLGFTYYSGTLWSKTIFPHIERLSISISHFYPTLYRKERRGIAKEISKSDLEINLSEKLTLKQLAKIYDCSITNIRHYVKKFGLKLYRGSRGKLPKDYERKRLCVCGETDPSNFYGNKMTICGKCHNKHNAKNGKEKKEFARNYLGGKCLHCNYDTYQCALDIHHVSPEHKDAFFASMRGWSIERIVNELQHCVLLCRNCHAACHSGLISVSK
jgi:hypothetical protein